MVTKQSLRKELMAQRRSTNAAQRAHAAQAVADAIAATRWLAPGKRIGLYASMPQELGTRPLIELALQRGCKVYLPRITSMRARRMRFVPIDIGDRAGMRRHDFGMQEPEGDEWIGARFLDTIFVAGVAFDRQGARLGHGAGFYDRALSFRRARHHWRGPRLVALAYSFQVVPHVPVTPHDVFMDYIVTERGIDELLADEN
ncbi:MAG TPA: 5-formyltetrahydrofolate cyclo-ligase [Steroidobacteraceae bacterium]|nr:5-formyltetrahydrofolate cyclo-ligase [Steroidobacteraceae bacterium]